MNVRTVIMLAPGQTRGDVTDDKYLIAGPLPDGLRIERPADGRFVLTNPTADWMRVWFEVRGKRAELAYVPVIVEGS